MCRVCRKSCDRKQIKIYIHNLEGWRNIESIFPIRIEIDEERNEILDSRIIKYIYN